MEAKAIKCVIFDMDGLLVDTERVYIEGWIDAIDKRGYDIPHEVIRSWVGKSVTYSSRCLADYTEDVEAVRAERENYIYEQLHSGSIREKPYATEVLQALRQKGYCIGLATSSAKQRSKDILKTLNLLQYFDYTAFLDDVKQAKPAPDLYLHVMHQAGVSPDACLIVEDSMTGAEAAGRAGVNVVLIPDQNFTHPEREYPEHVIWSGTDLRTVYQALEIV